MRRARPSGLALLLALLGAAGAAASDESAPFATAWIVVSPGDPRIAALAKAPPLPLSPNAPGLLLDVPASGFGNAESEESARLLVSSARRAGWRAGLGIDLPDTAVPIDPRAAEASTPETLYPGLGKLLSASSGADLVVLGFPALGEKSLPARRFILRKVASSIRAESRSSRVALVVDSPSGVEPFSNVAREFLAEDVAAYVDLFGLRASEALPEPSVLREVAERIGPGRPLLLVVPPQRDAASLLDLVGRYAPAGVPALAARLRPESGDDFALLRFGRLLVGDFGPDARGASARTHDDTPLPAYRFLAKSDLGGVVLVPGIGAGGAPFRGEIFSTLDADAYSSFEVTELSTGRSGRFEIPPSKGPPTLTLSTASGPLAIVLVARERPPAELRRASEEATAIRGITAEEILARHQAWRAARDARWKRLSARNTTSYRLRLAELNESAELTVSGAFFFEPGAGYDWVWEEAFFNGVRWPGKTVPKLPLLQPEKVSELPLALTFGDAYRYRLDGEDDVGGLPCWRLTFEPVAEFSDRPILEGEVFISRQDFSVVRVRSRQKNLKGDIQSADETIDFENVAPPGGGPAMRFPVRVKGFTILRTFSRTTTIERETTLTEVVLDPPSYAERKAAALASNAVMVRDTEEGIRYLEKTKEGGRRPAPKAKSSQLFGLAGLIVDASYDTPLALLGVYYVDLDANRAGDQTQIVFGGILLAGSFSRMDLFGTKLEAGADVFGIAIRSNNTVWVDGQKSDAETVKTRSFEANLNLAYPIVPHLKVAVTVGGGHRDFGEASTTAPGFVIPSDHWLCRLEGRLTFDAGGYNLSGSYSWNRRSRWEPWGYPGNPDYTPDRDRFRTWNVALAKDFNFARFTSFTASGSWAGTVNADRFSKVTTGDFGRTFLIGFSSGSLRVEQAVALKSSFGISIGTVFRLAVEYDEAWVWDAPSGYSGTSFAGAGVVGSLPGPWSTLLRFTVGTPVIGRDKGFGGVTASLNVLAIF